MLRMMTVGAVLAAVGAQPVLGDVASAERALREEPKVLDLLYQPGAAVEWQIGVCATGSPAHGFASYVCDLLTQHGAIGSKTIVRIVDAARVKAGSGFRDASLGSVRCATYEQMTP